MKQHAYNPVDWVEWDKDAFDRAEREDKLILVSIGYSACHWCHVMAHECFEDAEIAEIMNRHFVCIKIDREELPDIDQIYMDACQLINNSGGWPLNAITLPDKRPIHALTYAPKDHWKNVLESLQNLWVKDKKSAYEYAEKLSHGIQEMSLAPTAHKTTDTQSSTSVEVFHRFSEQFDEVYGGNKRAPKFPLPSNWKFLLQYGRLFNEEKARSMGLFTLTQMALGGIYDAVGGGFARYSVDGRWFAPHFEKMLYDNAQLIGLYSYAYAVSGDESFKKTTMQTIAFCKSELFGEGLYYSALDADSEGVEGLYYTYTIDEINKVLEDDSDLFAWYFQCTEQGNWEHGRNILYAIDSREKSAKEKSIEAEQFSITIDACLHRLKMFREQRIKPGLDDKCICSWNALMLKGLSEAALWLEEPDYLQDAEELGDAMLSTFFIQGNLKRIYKEGHLKIPAYLEDYACLLDALLSVYSCSLKEKYLHIAFDLAELSIKKFYRPENGFFAFNESKALIAEKFDITDDVINSGNSIMASVLWKLSWYFDREDFKSIVMRMMDAVSESMRKSGPWYSNWATLQNTIEQGTVQYILSAENSMALTFPFSDYAAEPNAIFGYVGKETKIPLFKGKEYKGKDLIYPCRDLVCGLGIEL